MRNELDYLPSDRKTEPLDAWQVLGGVSIISPFLAVPVFIVGTALLQDQLVSDGDSWLRAALYIGVPTGLVTIISLLAATRALWKEKNVRKAAIFAVVANALTLTIIVGGIFSAAP